MEYQQDSFLDVKLTATGAAQLKRLFVSTRWLFIIGMLLNLMLITNAVIRSFLVNPERLMGNPPLYLEFKLYTWYALLYCILFTFQLRFFFRFVRQADRGAEKLDSMLFNESFQLLNKANTMGIIHMSLSIFIGLLDTWANINMAKTILHY